MNKFLLMTATALMLTACNVDKAPDTQPQSGQGAGDSGGTTLPNPKDQGLPDPNNPKNQRNPALDKAFTAQGEVNYIDEQYDLRPLDLYGGEESVKAWAGLHSFKQLRVPVGSITKDGKLEINITAETAKDFQQPLGTVFESYAGGTAGGTKCKNNLIMSKSAQGVLIDNIYYDSADRHFFLHLLPKDRTQINLLVYANEDTPVSGSIVCEDQSALLFKSDLKLKAGWNELALNQGQWQINQLKHVEAIEAKTTHDGLWLYGGEIQ